ncbi:MAG: L,D-transpeptidase [Brevefilum sp.]
MMRAPLSRRAFIKLCSTGLAGLLLPTHLLPRLDADAATRSRHQLLGRVQRDRYPLYASPDANAEVTAELKMDHLHKITGIKVADDDSSANRTWYQLDGSGYAHSRYIQPVRMQINSPALMIPEKGCLGEITIPYLDAYSSATPDRKRLYRFYYGSTFWVTNLITDEEDLAWYELLDDRNYTRFFIPAYGMRLVPKTELTALSPQVPYEEKKLVVDLASQTLTAYIGDKVIRVMRVSTGVRLPEGGFATPKGAYRTTRKRPCRHMYAPPSEFGTGFDLPGVPWVSYFTGDGVAFHGTYWHNDYGVPHSHGCINMTPQAAKWLYRWTTPTVPHDEYIHADNQGTRVIVQ